MASPILSIEFCMDGNDFQAMNEAEARSALRQFLMLANEDIPDLVSDCAVDGMVLDFTSGSEFIRRIDVYQRGAYDFDRNSKELIALVGFYFGECFVRTFRSLRWDCGNTRFAYANMPVVAGFSGGKELQPMWITNNLIRRVFEDRTKIGDLHLAIRSWIESASSE